MSLSEYGKDMNRGILVIPEGTRGEGWRWFVVKLREAVSLSSISEPKNKAVLKNYHCPSLASRPKTSFVGLVKRASSTMVSKGGSIYWWEGQKEASVMLLQPECFSHMKNVWSYKRMVSSILKGYSLVDVFFLIVDCGVEDVSHIPFCSLPPLPSFSSPGYLSSNWVIKKFKNIQEIYLTTKTSCERFDEQFKALLFAIEMGCVS